jgi:hypothetical protein
VPDHVAELHGGTLPEDPRLAGALPPLGAWIALGSPRNVHGNDAPGTVFAFMP